MRFRWRKKISFSFQIRTKYWHFIIYCSYHFSLILFTCIVELKIPVQYKIWKVIKKATFLVLGILSYNRAYWQCGELRWQRRINGEGCTKSITLIPKCNSRTRCPYPIVYPPTAKSRFEILWLSVEMVRWGTRVSMGLFIAWNRWSIILKPAGWRAEGVLIYRARVYALCKKPLPKSVGYTYTMRCDLMSRWIRFMRTCVCPTGWFNYIQR